MTQDYREIVLSDITPSPFNPRKKFEGLKFDELVASIEQKGVIEPIIVRPVQGKQTPYELVAGERRWRASCSIASKNGGLEHATIPSLVKELNDDDAFDILTIENLQREGLTELEEAQGFKAYIDRHGHDSIGALAERTGINAGYINRRIRILSLPKKMLTDWEQGKLHYGHLEQIMRVDDKKLRSELHEEALGNEYNKPSVQQIKRRIDNMAPHLDRAPFDIDDAGCRVCGRNSDTQKRLWTMEMESAVCHDPKCFKQHVNNYLLANFKRLAMKKKHKTNGFRFARDLGYSEYESFHKKAPVDCAQCDDFVSLVDEYGQCSMSPYYQVCIGSKECYKKMTSKVSRQKEEASGPEEAPSPEDANKPRVGWHGEYFREKFFRLAIPAKYHDFKRSKFALNLFAILKSERELWSWFAEKMGMEVKRDDMGVLRWWSVSPADMWESIKKLEPVDLSDLINEATLQIIMRLGFGSQDRSLVADYIGLDLAAEWSMDKEYLDKKTKDEILRFGEELGIFADPKAQAFLFEVLGKKRGKFHTCKKPELVRLILESGVNLVGKVPGEILNSPKNGDSIETDIPYNVCRQCGCTEYDCNQCIEAQGEPCHWVEPDLCSRCADEMK